MNNEEGWVIGLAETPRLGSRVEFKVCLLEEWNKLTESEKDARLLEVAWESDSIRVFLKEQTR